MIELTTYGPALNSSLVTGRIPSTGLPSSTVGIVLLVVALVVGLPGNLFVVWTVIFRLRRRSVTSLLVLQLAAADCLVLLTAPVFLRQLSVGGAWELGDAACRIVHYGCGVNMYVSVYLITLMAADRLLGVSRPFMSQRVRTKSHLWPAVGAIWAMAVLLSIPVAVYKHVDHEQHCVSSYPSLSHEVFHYCLEIVAAFVLPFSALAMCYCRISRTLQAARVRWRRRSRQKTNRLIMLILGSFVLLWMPYQLVNVLQTAALLASQQGAHLYGVCKNVRPMVIALAYLSSSINPLLYACAGTTFTGASGLGCIARLLEGTSSEVNSRMGDSRGEAPAKDNSVKMAENGDQKK